MSKHDLVAVQMRKAHSSLGSWRAVGRKYGITPALARLISLGHVPTDPAIREKLGLPALATVAACPDCGTAHTVDGLCHAVRVVVYRAVGERPPASPTLQVRRARATRPKRLRDLPTATLRQMLENRHEF